MAMTNETMNPAPAATLSLSAEQAKEAAAKLQAKIKAEDEQLRAEAVAKASTLAVPNLNSESNKEQEKTEDPLADVKASFEDQVRAEEIAANRFLGAQKNMNTREGVAIKDLTEADAYNLEVAIVAKNMGSPDFLKISLKDPNYIARWCNRNPIRMSQLVGQGFRMVKEDEIYNLESLNMFLDAQGNFVYADLVAMKIPKNIYYAGLRRAYLKSLHATNNKKAAEAGAQFAASRLQGEMTGAERSYMAAHDLTDKPIYNPNLGV